MDSKSSLKSTGFVVFQENQYSYVMWPHDLESTHFECPEAGICQLFDTQDIPGLLKALPDLIGDEQQWRKKHPVALGAHLA